MYMIILCGLKFDIHKKEWEGLLYENGERLLDIPN